MSISLTRIGQLNSVSYQDLVGLLAGISRALGESTAAFKGRIELNANSQKSHTYTGTLENINTRLGLSMYEAISISSSVITDISYDFGKIVLFDGTNTTNIPTLTTSPDGFWDWRQMSEVVTDINAVTGCTAVLVGPDGPTMQLAKQMNSGWVINELVTSQVYKLQRGDLYVYGSEIFSTAGTIYTITNGIVTLPQEPVNLSISYQYKKMPYTLIASEGALVSLTDTALQEYVIFNNDLIFQVKEVIQTLMNSDGSYWAA